MKNYIDDVKKISKSESFENVMKKYDYGKYNFEERKKANENDSDYKDKIETNFVMNNDTAYFENNINKIALWKLNRYIVFNNPEEAKEKLRKLMQMSNECLNDEIDKIAEGMLENGNNTLYKTMEYFFDNKNVIGIRLAMLSTIFRFFKPDVFPIIDVRAYRSSWVLYFQESKNNDEYERWYSDRKDGKKLKGEEKRLKPKRIKENNRIVEYCRYIKRCQDIRHGLKLDESVSMADMDIYLYKIDEITKEPINQDLIN